MGLLGLAVVFFAVVHLIPAIPPLKAALADRCGRWWGPVYGTAASLGLLAIIAAFMVAPFVAVYEPPAWGRAVTLALMALAAMLLGVFAFRGRARLFLRFPLALAATVWGSAHLFANGDGASLILFGGLALYGLAHFALGWASGLRPEGEPRGGHDLMAPLAGLALYAAMAQLHPVIIGVPVLAP